MDELQRELAAWHNGFKRRRKARLVALVQRAFAAAERGDSPAATTAATTAATAQVEGAAAAERVSEGISKAISEKQPLISPVAGKLQSSCSCRNNLDGSIGNKRGKSGLLADEHEHTEEGDKCAAGAPASDDDGSSSWGWSHVHAQLEAQARVLSQLQEALEESRKREERLAVQLAKLLAGGEVGGRSSDTGAFPPPSTN